MTSAGESATMHVTSVSLPAATAIRRTSFPTDTLLGKNSPAVIIGSMVTMTGFFSQPPVQSASGKPVREMLLSKGIQVEFDGRIVNTAPTMNPVLMAWAELPARLARRTSLSTTDAALFVSLLFGGTDVAADERSVFLRAGLLHLLAASGANVLLVGRCWMAVWGPICRRLPASRWLRVGGELTATWAFVAMCGSQSSIIRAGCMSTYRGLGQTFGRASQSLDGLLIAAYVMALWQPVVWQQPGTWLSFAATYAVSLAIQSQTRNRRRKSRTQDSKSRFLERGMRVLHAVWHLALSTVTVELLTLPFVLHWFGQLSTVSVLANLIAEPIMIMLLPIILVLVFAVALPDFPGLHVLVAGLGLAASGLLRVLLNAAGWLGHWRSSYLMLSSFTWTDVVVWYVALFLWFQCVPLLKRHFQSAIMER